MFFGRPGEPRPPRLLSPGSAVAGCVVGLVGDALVAATTTLGQTTGSAILQTSIGAVSAQLTGYASPDPGLSLNPTALIFRNIPDPTATTQTITLSNTGSTTLQLSAPSTTTANYAATSNCSTLIPSATCTITVSCTFTRPSRSSSLYAVSRCSMPLV